MAFLTNLFNFPDLATLGAGLTVLFIVLLLWSMFWKAWALWAAATRKSKVWFIILFVVNSVGILEIIYLFVIGKKHIKAELTGQAPPK